MTDIAITVRNDDTVSRTFESEIIPAGGNFTYALGTAFNDLTLHRAVLANPPEASVSVDGGTTYIADPKVALQMLFGTSVEFRFEERVVDANNRVKFATTPDLHGSTHESGGTDEFDVTDLSGVLADDQHPIASEVVAALGAKANNNPLNHDRFAQTEIVALPESQLNLNFPTHTNANDPTASQKAALDAANSPGAGNGQFLTGTEGDLRYATTGHTHPTLPTSDQKDALDNANSPASGNPYATQNDLTGLSGDFVEQNATALLARTGDAVGKAVKVLEDETISAVLWEAGWYTYRGAAAGGGFDNSDWNFHSTRENHTHDWADVSKSGSLLSDLGDVPAKPNDGSEYVLQELNGTLSWILKSSLGGGGSGGGGGFVLTLTRDGDTSLGKFLRTYTHHGKEQETAFVPPFDMKVSLVAFASKEDGDTAAHQVEVRAYVLPATDGSKIEDDDPIAWSFDSLDANVTYNHLNSRYWGYDATSDNFTMTTGNRYAFYVIDIVEQSSEYVQIILTTEAI